MDDFIYDMWSLQWFHMSSIESQVNNSFVNSTACSSQKRNKNIKCTLLALQEENVLITDGFPLLRANNAERLSMSWHLCLYHEGILLGHRPLCWSCPGGHFKNTYELLNLRALKFSHVNTICIFQCMGKIFCVEFQRYLWNSTQNILHIHWKISFLYNMDILRALRFKSSYTFFEPPPPLPWFTSHLWRQIGPGSLVIYEDKLGQ